MAESEHEHLINHLRDTHALEQQSIRQLERSQEMSQAGDMRDLYGEHLEETREHERLISERIESKDLKPSAVKDLTMRAGAIGLRQLAEIPPDTPVVRATTRPRRSPSRSWSRSGRPPRRSGRRSSARSS